MVQTQLVVEIWQTEDVDVSAKGGDAEGERVTAA